MVMVLAEMDKPDIRKTGTTTIGIVCRDGVVLSAEKKSTMGYLVASKETEKISEVDDHIAMTIAGASGDAQTLVRYMRAELKLFAIQSQRKISVKGAASLLANMLQGARYAPYMVQLIIAGYDKEGGHVFSLDAIGAIEEEHKFFSTGSGSPFALGVLEDGFKDGLSVNEAADLAVRAIRAAVERDIGSGGKAVDVVKITKDGIAKESYPLGVRVGK
jgi:proteasome beta subunit